MYLLEPEHDAVSIRCVVGQRIQSGSGGTGERSGFMPDFRRTHIPGSAMLTGWLSSLRGRLLCLVLFACVPPFVSMFHAAIESRRLAVANAEARLLAQARFAASDLEKKVLKGAEHLLIALSRIPELARMQQPACSELLAGMMARYHRFSNLFVADAAGSMVCSGGPRTGRVNVADRDYFRLALQSTEPVVGQPIIGRVAGRPVLPSAYRLTDDDGKVIGMVGASLDLAWFSKLVTSNQAEPGAIFSIWDGSGRLLARYPDPQDLAGQRFPDAPITRLFASGRNAGNAEMTDTDGVSRIYGFVAASPDGANPIGLVVDVPKESLFAQIDRIFVRQIAFMTAVALLTLLAAWAFGEFAIRRRVAPLQRTVEAIGAGDTDARVPTPVDRSELGELGRGINRMAESLEAQRAALQHSAQHLENVNRMLRMLSDGNQALIRATDESALLNEVCRIAVQQGDYRMAWVGFTEPGEGGAIAAVAHAGFEAGYLDALRASWGDDQFSRGATGMAIRNGQPVIVRHIPTDPSYASWRAIAAEHGFASVIALPLHFEGRVGGALSIYSGQPDAFDQDETALLKEMADDLAFGIETLRLRARHAESQQEILRLNADLERRVAARTSELEAANEALESFSYSVSHDLRAPLRAIDGFSAMLADQYGPQLDPEGRRRLTVIRTNTRKMEQLIDDLLMFSKLARRPLAALPVDMAGLARSVYEELRADSGARAVSFSVGALPEAVGDAAMLRQVWANLLGNALKFTSRCEHAVIELGGYVEDSESVFFLKDNGAGFDMHYADKLFGVFQRLHREADFPGTGVGLAIVKRVITRHGGRVWAEGRLGAGATFFFSLPGPDTTARPSTTMDEGHKDDGNPIPRADPGRPSD